MLRRRANFVHNDKVLRDRGILVVEKRPSGKKHEKKHQYQEYLPCEICSGFYFKTDLRKDRRTCIQRLPGSKIPTRVCSEASMLLYTDRSASTLLKRILKPMNHDDVSMCVRNDDLIIMYGNVCDKHNQDIEGRRNRCEENALKRRWFSTLTEVHLLC